MSVSPPERPPLVEAVAVPEFWVDGIGKVESLGGGVYRFWLYRNRRPLDGDGPMEREVVCSTLATLDTVHSAILVLRALAEGALERLAMLIH